jgi:hypothetical protein
VNVGLALRRMLVASMVSGGLAFGYAPIGLATPDERDGTAAQGTQVIAISDADNGRIVKITPGASVELKLRSTYWTIKGSSDPSILAAQGSPQIEPGLARCPPGSGCGSIVQSFTAITTGQAELSGERQVCGEAMRCPPERRNFKVTVVVQP